MKRRNVFGVCVGAFVLLLAAFPVKGQAAKEQGAVKIVISSGSSAKEIQQALDQAKTWKEADQRQLIVTLEQGDYELEEDLVIYSDTVLIARDCKLMKKHEKGPMLRNYLYDREKGRNYAANIKIIGGLWNAGAGISTNKGDETFRFIHARNVEIRDVTIKNIVRGHMLTIAGVKQAVIDGCTFAGYCKYGTTKEALHIDLVHSKHMVPVVESSKERICYDDAPCKEITVTNCKFYNVPAGVGSHSAVRGVYNEDILINDNTFINIEAAAIRCYNYKNVKISGNVIKRAGMGMEIYTCTKNSENMDDDKTSFHFPNSGVDLEQMPRDDDYGIRIENNQVSMVYNGKDRKFGNAIWIAGGERRPISNLIICDNRIAASKKKSIYLQYAPNARISGNKIINEDSNAYIGGIYLNKCNKATVEKNTIRFTQRAVEMIQSNDGTVKENQISDSIYDGIYLRNRSRHNCIKKNYIANTFGTAIAVEERADGNEVKNNSIKNANIGIFIKDARKTKLINNHLEGMMNQKIVDRTK